MVKKVISVDNYSEVATCLHDLILWVDQLHLWNTDVHGGTSLLRLESSIHRYTHYLNARGT